MAPGIAMKPEDVLRAIAAERGDAIVVPTMTTAPAWRSIAPNDLSVTCVGFMGGASSLGLGLALARPDRRVLVLDGDGSLLMQLGSLATVAGAAPRNLVHFLFKNGVYHTSGAQGIPGGLSVDFVMMARGAGYRMASAIDDLGDFKRRLPELLRTEGPVFVELHTGLAEQTPMTVRERTPFHQQLHDARVKLLRPRATRARPRTPDTTSPPEAVMPLDPQAQRVIEAMAALNLKPVESSTPDEARESIRTRTAALGPFEDVAAVADHRVPVAGGEITVRAYSPGGPGPHPVLVYYHGGGWVIGDLYTHDGLCRSLTNAARCAVVSVDYRLAPESKYPVAAEDSYAALRWIVANAARLGIDPRRVAVGGDSAGGNLATVVALMARERGGPALVHQVLIYPSPTTT